MKALIIKKMKYKNKYKLIKLIYKIYLNNQKNINN